MEVELMEMIKDKMSHVTYYHQIKEKMNREDLISDTYIKLITMINSGRIASDLKEIEGYVFISCRNNAIKFNKKLMRDIYSNDLDHLPERIFEYDEESFNVEEKKNELLDLIQLDFDRDVMRLRMDGKTFKDIGEILGCHKSVVFRSFYRTKYNVSVMIGKGKIKGNQQYLYKVTNTETGEVNIFRNKRGFEKLYNISRAYVDELLNHNILLQGKYYFEKILK